MKIGPVIAMALLLFLGVWLVLQPTLARGASDLTLSVGAVELMLERVEHAGAPAYEVIAPSDMFTDEPILASDLDAFIQSQIAMWNERPAWEQRLLGFFNITRWSVFGFVAIGLIGQSAFFGRMMVQWIVSERSRVSTVPVSFWWMSFIGGVCLFTYFVWRTDIVGVIGQSTGIVIYARNLRLIHKQRRASQAS